MPDRLFSLATALAVVLTVAISFDATAQVERRYMLLYTEGNVRYKPAENPEFRVFGGDYVQSGGSLTLPEGGRAEIGYAHATKTLTEAGRYRVSELFEDTELESSGFLSRFFNFISTGLDQSKSRKTLEKAYLENQGNAQGNTRGLSSAGLGSIRPFGGKLTADPQTFRWPADAAADHYEFSILHEETGDFLITAILRDTAFLVDLGSLDLAEGNRYIWSCRAVTEADAGGAAALLGRNAPTTELANIRFTFVDAPLAALDRTYRRDVPAGAGPVLTALGRAQYYERVGYLAAADATYRDLLYGDRPAELARPLYASFLGRWNLRSEAAELIRE